MYIQDRVEQYTEDRIKIKFYYSKEKVDRVKTLWGRRWHPEQKFWTADLNTENIEKLLEWGYCVNPCILGWYDSVFNKYVYKQPVKMVPNMKLKPYPFQLAGIDFMNRTDGRCLIADEMGLGKTIQVIGYIGLLPNVRPVVIVVPASMKLKWQQEILRCFPDYKVDVIFGRKEVEIKNEIIIINYDILAYHKYLSPKILIFDECHMLKNTSAKRTKAAKCISKEAEHVIGLSGTPIMSRPSEFFSILNIITPGVWSNWKYYADRFCGPKEIKINRNGAQQKITVYKGATNLSELHEKLKSVMIRRKKVDVLSDLPDKMVDVVPVEIENRLEYSDAEMNFIDWVKENHGILQADKAKRAEGLTKINYLKQLIAEGKKKSIVEWITNFLACGEKLVVFCVHRAMVDFIFEEFKDVAVKLDGRTPSKDRLGIEEKFQKADNIKLFVGNMHAAGVGLTLTSASKVLFVELGWTPGVHDQAGDRVHRISQKNSVVLYYLIAQNSIEENILKVLDDKRSILDKVVDGKFGEPGVNIADKLFEKYGDG